MRQDLPRILELLARFTSDPLAADRIMPSATSERAQVSVQDAGSYTLFKKIKGGLWTAFNDGLGRAGGGCPQALPASILTMWGWDPQYCRPLG